MHRFHQLGTVDLRDEAGEEIRTVLAQPKRLALLVYLSSAAPGGTHRRDTLLAMFWPELDDERGRNALSKGLHFLRQALGAEAVVTRTTDEVGIDPSLVWSDVREFRAAVRGGRMRDALELYRGELLSGFHLSDAPGFERWLEKERVELRTLAANAAKAMAETLLADRQITGAVEHARKAVEFSGQDERMLRRLLVLLQSVGDRAAAVRTYENFARQLDAEFGSVPAPETQALIARIRMAASPEPGGWDATGRADANPFDQLAAALSDRYILERELGSGGSATVYLATDLKLHRKVAVKVLRPSLSASVAKARFLHEIFIAAGLNHPHIVPLLDSGDAAGFVFYVMPWVTGESLRDRMGRAPLPVAEAVHLAREVADALAYAHVRGVVHRDIKPENILIESGHALVADFGIASAVNEAGNPSASTGAAGSGTPAYISPEATTGGKVDPRTDLYSLGCVLFEMLTGRPPFTGPSAVEIMEQHRTMTPPAVDQIRPGLPDAVVAATARALAKLPEARFGSATAFRDALAPGNPRPWLWLGGIAASLAVAIALGASVVSSDGTPVSIISLTRLSFGPEWATYPSISPDGERVAYQVRGGMPPRVVTIPVAGGPTTDLDIKATRFERFPEYAPEGGRLLYLSDSGLMMLPSGADRGVLVARRGETAGWSPDGRSIVYGTDTTLERLDLDSDERTTLLVGDTPGTPAWSPDGRMVAFTMATVGFHWEGNLASGGLYGISPDGGAAWELSSGGFNTSPVWLPDGRGLLFISDRDGRRDIYHLVLNRAGRPEGPPQRITTGLNVERITLSKDGTRLALSVTTESSNIWALRHDPTTPIPMSTAWRVTSGNRVIENFDISPDRKWIYFDSDHRGVSNIWRTPLTGGEETQLTFGGGGDFGPKVSPDGQTVAFHAIRTGNRDIYAIPAGGGDPLPLSSSPEHNMNVHWSPDGQRVIWDEIFNSDSLLWHAERFADGTWSEPALLWAGLGRQILHPTWSPDGRWIAFHGDDGIQLLSTDTWRTRVLVPGRNGEFVEWSDDGRYLFYAAVGRGARFEIRYVSVDGGPERLAAYADDPWRQGHRFGLSVAGDTLYFGLVERTGEIWVGELRID